MLRLQLQDFQKITQVQLLRADRQAIVRMSEQGTGSWTGVTAAGKPLDPYLEKLDSDMIVTYFMLPIPTSHGPSASSGDKSDKDKKRREAPMNQNQPGANKFQSETRDSRKAARAKNASLCPGFEGHAFQDSSGGAHVFWIQSWIMQAGCTLSSKACLCGPWVLQGSSSDRAPVT